ncbi:MAG: hypothetical protein AAGD40_11530, partial [Pseudomonadota bacterium]
MLRQPMLRILTVSLLCAAGMAAPVQAALAEERGLSDYVKGRHAAAKGELSRAAGLFEATLGYAPADDYVLQTTYELAIASGDEGLALGTARRLAASSPYDSGIGMLLVADAVKRGKWDMAGEYLERLGDSGVGSFAIPVVEAWILVGRGEGEKARARLLDDPP